MTQAEYLAQGNQVYDLDLTDLFDLANGCSENGDAWLFSDGSILLLTHDFTSASVGTQTDLDRISSFA